MPFYFMGQSVQSDPTLLLDHVSKPHVLPYVPRLISISNVGRRLVRKPITLQNVESIEIERINYKNHRASCQQFVSRSIASSNYIRTVYRKLLSPILMEIRFKVRPAILLVSFMAFSPNVAVVNLFLRFLVLIPAQKFWVMRKG